jgi:hypothetical protein
MITISTRLNIYPETYKSWTNLANIFNDTIKEFPELMKLDWNNEVIIRFYHELNEIIPFACLFSLSTIKEKIASSESLMEISKKWFISIENIENSIDNLVFKYPELNKDDLLFNTTNYITAKISWRIFMMQIGLNPEIPKDFSFKRYFENYRKRIRETPKNKIKAIGTVSRIGNSMVEQVKYNKQNPQNKNGEKPKI